MDTRMNERDDAGTTHRLDAVVVGAGFGGMYAAYRLREMGLSFVGIEAGDLRGELRVVVGIVEIGAVGPVEPVEGRHGLQLHVVRHARAGERPQLLQARGIGDDSGAGIEGEAVAGEGAGAAAGAVGLIATTDWSFSNGRDWGSPIIPQAMDLKTIITRSPEAITRPHWFAQFARTGRPPELSAPNLTEAGRPAPGFFEAYYEWMQTPPPTWDDIGKLGAIAFLRTALNFFLQKEIEAHERQHGRAAHPDHT